MDWLDRADDLLYEGETVAERVTVGDGGVVVTSHRVLVFTPERAGANYAAVDRPNVTGVEHTADGDGQFLERAVQPIAVGLVLVVAGQLVSFDGLASGVDVGSGASRVGAGGLIGMMQAMLNLLANLDELLTVFGGLALLLGAVVLGVWAWSRESVLRVGVAGGEDLTLPAPEEDADAVARRLEAAILP